MEIVAMIGLTIHLWCVKKLMYAVVCFIVNIWMNGWNSALNPRQFLAILLSIQEAELYPAGKEIISFS